MTVLDVVLLGACVLCLAGIGAVSTKPAPTVRPGVPVNDLGDPADPFGSAGWDPAVEAAR